MTEQQKEAYMKRSSELFTEASNLRKGTPPSTISNIRKAERELAKHKENNAKQILFIIQESESNFFKKTA